MHFNCASMMSRKAVLTAYSWILFGPGCSGRSRFQRKHHRLPSEDCKTFSWNGGSLNLEDLNAVRDVSGLHGQVEEVAHKKICLKEATLKR